MPSGLIRIFAVVLALVVPLQGMAALTTAQCMALAHHQDAVGHGGHADAQAGHYGPDHSLHSHDQAVSDAASDDTGNKGSHCGPCTACCASVSIAGAAGLSIFSSASGRPYIFSQFAPPSVPLDGLDRPPAAL